MKHLILSALALAVSISVNAQKVVIDLTSGTSVSYVASSIKFFEDSTEYVDLGLSVKWATCNVGAENCYDYGLCFAWGETTGYGSDTSDGRSFNWANYKLCKGSSSTIKKYSQSTSYWDSSLGTDPDGKTVLDKEDDAAYVNWGGKWRMPTFDELNELNNTSNCSWTWYDAGNDEFNGVAGYKVQSLKQGYTDKYIFLPAAGYRWEDSVDGAGSYGDYWSSTLNPNDSGRACDLSFGCGNHNMYDTCYRFGGRRVRPVKDAMSANAQKVAVNLTSGKSSTYYASEVSRIKIIEDSHEYVDLGLSVKWATCNVGAERCYDWGDYFAWGETTGYGSDTSDGRSFNWASYKWMTEGQSSWQYCTKYTTADGRTSGCWYSNGTYVGTTVDGVTYTKKTVLDKEDDAAYVNWGGKWRMPTYDELNELYNTSNCSWTWYDAGNDEFNGVAGYKVQSLKQGYTDKFIFLPAAGCRDDSSLYDAGSCGGYWASSLDSSYSSIARFQGFNSSSHSMGYSNRCDGRSVRPVTE